MLGLFRKQRPEWLIPAGRRVYAVGDIHGRLDLLDDLLDLVEHDISVRPPAENYVIFLGDLIDRGPASRQVVERLRTLETTTFRPVFLTGNHEEVLLRLLAGERDLLQSWLRFGGAECLRSYGVSSKRFRQLDDVSALAALE